MYEYRLSFFEIDDMNIDEVILLIKKIRSRNEDSMMKELMMMRIKMLSIHDPSECMNILDKIENRYKLKKELAYGY